MLNEIRKGLIEAYKHKLIEGKACVVCGRNNTPFALHMIEFYHDNTIVMPPYFVPMSQNNSRLRGSVPICDKCCPPCSKCGLPIATKWIRKIKRELESLHPDLGFSIGNGYCRDHIHIGKDVKAIFKKVSLKGVDIATYKITQNQKNEEGVVQKKKPSNSKKDSRTMFAAAVALNAFENLQPLAQAIEKQFGPSQDRLLINKEAITLSIFFYLIALPDQDIGKKVYGIYEALVGAGKEKGLVNKIISDRFGIYESAYKNWRDDPKFGHRLADPIRNHWNKNAQMNIAGGDVQNHAIVGFISYQIKRAIESLPTAEKESGFSIRKDLMQQ